MWQWWDPHSESKLKQQGSEDCVSLMQRDGAREGGGLVEGRWI